MMEVEPLLQDIPQDDHDLMYLLEVIGTVLEERGGTVTDVGYDMVVACGELVVQAPDGTLVEITARILSD